MNKTFTRKTVNGRDFQLLTLPGANLFKFEIVNMYGANIERAIEANTGQNVYGLSHLIEHLGFRSTKDFTTPQLMDLLKTEGTYNASTDHDRINYWFKTTHEHMDNAIRLVCNYALNDLKKISAEEFEIERNVVFNEAKQYADNDQTMFAFNIVSTVCGYHAEDNVIGIPDTVAGFKLDDAIALKETFLANGKQIFNVTYDPTIMSEDDVIASVTLQLDRFAPTASFDKELDDKYNTLCYYPSLGDFTMENEAEQALTGVIVDTIMDNIWTARRGNAYLARYATDTSLDDIIREQNGLTYGIGFYDFNISCKPYTYFTCDVTRGTEGLMMSLFHNSINTSVDEFNEEAHEKLSRTVRLKRSMMNVNQESYDNVFDLATWTPYIIDQVEELFAENIDMATAELDRLTANYDEMVIYLHNLRELVNGQAWSMVVN
jgi:hypothetical protein